MQRDEIPLGTLDLLILKSLARHGKLHSYEIANSIQSTSNEVLQVEEGSLYPALQRMLIKDRVKAEWCNGRQSAGPLLPAHRSRAEAVGCGALAIRGSNGSHFLGYSDHVMEISDE